MQNESKNIIDTIAAKGYTTLKSNEIAQGLSIGKISDTRLDIRGQLVIIVFSEEIKDLPLSDADRTKLVPIIDDVDIFRYYTEPFSDKYMLQIECPDIPSCLEPIIQQRKENGFVYATTGQISINYRPRVIVPKRAIRPSFSYANAIYAVTNKCNVITTERIDPMVLTSYLNSKVAKYWIRYANPTGNGTSVLDKKTLTSIPIIKGDEESQKAAMLINKYLIILSSWMQGSKYARAAREAKFYLEQYSYINDFLYLETLYKEQFALRKVEIAKEINRTLKSLDTENISNSISAIEESYINFRQTGSALRSGIKYIEVVLSPIVNPILNSL